jgi:ferredoxin-type protein NapH
MKRHLLKRFLGLILGLVLLYAPFALLVRILIHLTGSPLCADCHRICLRMPLQWLFQPWMYPTMLKQPMFLISILLLPAIALIFGPLFCGWLCPAGLFPEFLSRLIPERFKLKLSGQPYTATIRYGVLAGLILAPFLGGNVCCAFCNFAHMQNLVSAAFGNYQGLAHWSSFTLAAFVVWLLVLGVFTKGGRGWCNFICPAGALMGLMHAFGSKTGFGFAVRVDEKKCRGCQTCAGSCPVGAITESRPPRINPHLCNTCLDCVQLCAQKALHYDRPERAGH